MACRPTFYGLGNRTSRKHNFEFRTMGDIHILRHHRGGRGVTSLMTTDDKGEGGIDRTDDVIKTVMSQKWRAAHVRESQY